MGRTIIYLHDIFVAPDLKLMSNEKETSNIVYKTLNEVIDTEYEDGIKFLLLGDETSGRTTICKYLFTHYYNVGFLPIFVNSNEITKIRSDAFTSLISKKFKSQYTTNNPFESYPKDKILIIIDDFHKVTNKNREIWSVLVRNINSVFKNTIITGSTLMPLESVASKKNRGKQNTFQSYDVYNICELGHKLRHKIINKWNILGLSEDILDRNELRRKNDHYFSYVQSIIGNNYVPSFPFYVLTILQALETGATQNHSYSLHGFYYELIINDALARAVKDKKEISLYYNYLTDFCYFFFEQKISEILVSDFREFHKAYCDKYQVRVGHEKMLNTFTNAKLLCVNGSITIPYKYVYYFFTAKYLTNTIAKEDTREIISKICQRTYQNECASIIMFLTHLSKDEFIIDTLLSNVLPLLKKLGKVDLQQFLKLEIAKEISMR